MFISHYRGSIRSKEKSIDREYYKRFFYSNSMAPIWHTDSIQGIHPDDVILVRLHFDKNTRYLEWDNRYLDSMGVPDAPDLLGYKLYGTTWVAAFLNRKKFNNTFPVPKVLYSYVNDEINEVPKVALQVEWDINPETNEIISKVSAIPMENINVPLRFNLYIVEDSVTGTGYGWDQYNSISGLESWRPCPYVDMPDTIKNFIHRNVVRAIPGSTFGVQGEFTNPAEQGKIYEHVFNCKIDSRWDINKISVVGFISVYVPEMENYEVLNSARGKQNKQIFMNPVTDNVCFLSKGSSVEKTFSVFNNTEEEKNIKIGIKKSPGLPVYCNVEVSGDDAISLNPGESRDITVKATADAFIGYGEAIIELRDDNVMSSLLSSQSIKLVSRDINKINITDEGGFDEFSLKPILKDIKKDDYIDVDREVFVKYMEEFSNLKFLIWNTGHITGYLDSIGIGMYK
jgi:hypothetical protein